MYLYIFMCICKYLDVKPTNLHLGCIQQDDYKHIHNVSHATMGIKRGTKTRFPYQTTQLCVSISCSEGASIVQTMT